MPWPVGQKPPVYNFPIPVFNVVLRAATKGRFCPAGTRELLERDGGRKEGRSKRSSPGGISIHSCSLRDRSFMLFIISLSFTFFNIWFPCFQSPFPPRLQDHLPILLDFFLFFRRAHPAQGVHWLQLKSCNPCRPWACSLEALSLAWLVVYHDPPSSPITSPWCGGKATLSIPGSRCPRWRVFIPECTLFWALPRPEGRIAELFTILSHRLLKSSACFPEVQ